MREAEAYTAPTPGGHEPWYALERREVLQALGVDAAQGLSVSEAQRRLAETGPNELAQAGRVARWRILWDQIKETMVVILIAAAGISAIIGDLKDAAVILAIIVLNVILGYTQESRAVRAIEALRQLAIPHVQVRREGHICEASARDLTPGDIVLLEAGNVVPADGRLLESSSLRIQEAPLTGESEPVEKIIAPLSRSDQALGDRTNMAYMGTYVAYGRGLELVTATGMRTELGRVASLLHGVERETTPLQRRLDQLGKRLAVVALGIVALMFVLGIVRGEDLQTMFLTSVSLAVAVLPEGLPAVVTIALALGARRMLRQRALIRKLPAVETLGSVTVICSDKTGTLTQNRMAVTMLDVAGDRIDFTEVLHRDEPTVDVRTVQEPPLRTRDQAMRLLLASAALCSDARLEPSVEEPGEFHAVGDPTEGALVVAATRVGLRKSDLDAAFPRVGEVPFDSTRKRMTTAHAFSHAHPDISSLFQRPRPKAPARQEGKWFLIVTKGALTSVLSVCTGVMSDSGWEPLSEHWRRRILQADEELAASGMRVLGLAFRTAAESAVPAALSEEIERDLTFAGLVGLIDPARPEAGEAILTCQRAGIRPMLITGDHPLTARYISQELGIAREAGVLTGQELMALPPGALTDTVEQISVYARVAPEDKLAIVNALQARGEIVAMTGDGVNDAPALRKADIGVAMGITGTDVAKEAADMVLLDDNFATIVGAVAEGRVIYDNIRKFVRYLLATNSAEIWVMLLYPFLGLPLPLLPLQILWTNLVTDGLPALALSREPAEHQVMKRPPRAPNESLFARGLGWHVLWVGLVMGVLCLGTGLWFWTQGAPNWQTMIFTTLVLSQMAHVLAIRSELDSLFRIGPWTNVPLLGAVGLTVLLQLAVVYVPFLQAVFGTRALLPSELALSVGLSAVTFCAVELEKWARRRAVGRKGRLT